MFFLAHPMAQVNYTGVADPWGSFESLRPYAERLSEMAAGCRAGSKDQLLLRQTLQALHAAAYQFTGMADFYARRLERVRFQRGPEGSPSEGPL